MGGVQIHSGRCGVGLLEAIRGHVPEGGGRSKAKGTFGTAFIPTISPRGQLPALCDLGGRD